MGLTIARLRKPFNRFNIDNRARAIISKDKPTPAPKPPAAIKQLELAQKLNPDFLKTHYRKDLKLDEHLKNVYVTSTDPKVPTLDKPNPDRPLPISRTPADFEYGFYMPDIVPEGKCTLKQIIDIIQKYKIDSDNNNVNVLASEYKLNKEIVDKLLHYYKLYHIMAPKEEEEDEETVVKIQLKKLHDMKRIAWEVEDRKKN